MSASLTLFLPVEISQLEAIVLAFREEYEILLKDLFTDEELEILENRIDEIAAIYVQPIPREISFDDFYAMDSLEMAQREFFGRCRSSISLENLPFLENNAFQVTYLRELLKKFDDVLIDRGGINELLFKNDFLQSIDKLKGMDELAGVPVVAKRSPVKNLIPVDPIDFLVVDVYRELDRLKGREPDGADLSSKVRKIYAVVLKEKTDSTDLFRKSSLNAKDFDDCLEHLKFWLRKH